ncbi:MAG: DinB family protein [Dehalococcoidia bacterium]|nr:DinB family protein [Dehalococcoidia bacterium]
MTSSRTAEQEQVRAYLLAQTRDAAWLGLWPRVLQTRLELLEALRGVTAEQARFSTGDGAWSILEVASHLLEYSTSVRATIEALAQGRQPAAAPVLSVLTPPSDDARLTAVRDDLIRDAIALSALVASLPDDISLDVTVEHDWFGPLHAKAWFLFQRVHDMDHLRQVTSLKAAEGYPG